MLVKQKINPKPIYGKPNKGIVQPIRCTDAGEVLVRQVNPPSLEEVEQCLQNLRSDLSSAITVRNDRPVDVVLDKIKVDGAVTIKPVTVANMPSEIKIQENLHVIQVPIATRVAPFSFCGYGTVILSKPCKVYSVYLTVYEPTYIEVVGITGKIHTGEFKMDLFPLFIHLDKVEIKASEYVNAGGYILYEDC